MEVELLLPTTLLLLLLLHVELVLVEVELLLPTAPAYACKRESYRIYPIVINKER